MMIGITVSTNFAGRAIQRTGRYKRFPLAGLALMTLALLSLAAADLSRVTTSLALLVFGLGFGMVGQVLIVAVQNDVDPRQIGTAMATTSFARGLGGAVGAAVFGAVFSAQIDDGVASAVQTVFLLAAPVAALALLLTFALREVPLRVKA